MGQTPNYGLPYAELSDPPNGPQQQQALAEATDTALGGLDGRVTNAENTIATLVGARYAQAAQQTINRYTITDVPMSSSQWSRGTVVSTSDDIHFTLSKSGIWQIRGELSMHDLPVDTARPTTSSVYFSIVDNGGGQIVGFHAPAEDEGWQTTISATIEVVGSITVNMQCNAQIGNATYTVTDGALEFLWLGE